MTIDETALDHGHARPAPLGEGAARIESLDFVRGIAVMGILFANIIAFGQPMTAYMYPDAFLVQHGPADDWLWFAQFVLVDGKMRGLFTLLFGAGLFLFVDRARSKGGGAGLQLRRLLWLGAIGFCHYFFLWRGDILFIYAVAGLFALMFVDFSPRKQIVAGLIGYLAGAAVYFAMTVPMEAVASGSFPPGSPMAGLQADFLAVARDDLRDGQSEARLLIAGDYGGFVAHNFAAHLDSLGYTLLFFWLETLPLMVLGMGLYRLGLFSGAIERRRQVRWGAAALALGLATSVPIGLWALRDGLTYYGTLAALSGWSMLPRLAAIVGLAALLAVWGNRAGGWLAVRVKATGRAAFSNYLGTSLAMALVFHGWAGGLFGTLGRGELYLVAAATAVAMLAWSAWWLARFRFGPLEWLWRCLTYGQLFPIAR